MKLIDRLFYIRPAFSKDLSELLNIEDVCFQTDKLNRRQMRYMLEKAKAVFMVACNKEHDKAMGYGICLIPARKCIARLYSLAVLPEFRRLQIASHLLSFLLNDLIDKGYKYCHLEVRDSDKNTQKLYYSFQYIVFERLPGYYADGETALRMRAKLDNTARYSFL